MKTEQAAAETLSIDWDRYRPCKLTQPEVLEAFPEAAQIVPALLDELEQKRRTLVGDIKERLSSIETESADEMYRYFWGSWLELTLGQDLVDLDRKIARLNRQLRVIKGVPTPKGALTDDVIQAARDVPVESLFDQQFKRAGRGLVGLCPFHEERTPSFHIYPDQNRGWCFGCNQGGDVIDLTMMLHDCGFKKAVLLLTGGQL